MKLVVCAYICDLFDLLASSCHGNNEGVHFWGGDTHRANSFTPCGRIVGGDVWQVGSLNLGTKLQWVVVFLTFVKFYVSQWW